MAHTVSTGPEIWEQTSGKITCFVAGIGTGGTISGTARFLKEKNPDIRIIGADKEGSIYSGDMAKSYKVEGIGEDFIPSNVDMKIVDEMVRVSDKESFQMARRLSREEGLLAGGSCGTALKISENLTADDVVVVLMPDGGRGYLSKIYSDDWMRENGFLLAPGHMFYVCDLIDRKADRGKFPAMITVTPDDTVREAIELMEKHSIDQVPVVTTNGQNVGHVNDVVAMQVVYERSKPANTLVRDVMGRPFPQLEVDAELDELYKTFRLGNAMVVVTKNGKAHGVLTRFDIIECRSGQKRKV